MVIPNTLNKEVVDVINKAIAFEYQSHLFWNSASNWCANAGYNKAAAYYLKESLSELEHTRSLQDFLLGWNIIPQIPQVPMAYEFTSLEDTIDKSYNLMLDVFNHYVESSQQLFGVDLSTFDFLQQFRILQIAALAEYSNLLSGLELINKNNKLDVLFFETKYFKNK